MIAPKERRLWQRHHRLLQEQDSKESSKGRWRRKPHALDQEEKIHRGTACIVLFMVNPFPDFTPKAVGAKEYTKAGLRAWTLPRVWVSSPNPYVGSSFFLLFLGAWHAPIDGLCLGRQTKTPLRQHDKKAKTGLLSAIERAFFLSTPSLARARLFPLLLFWLSFPALARLFFKSIDSSSYLRCFKPLEVLHPTTPLQKKRKPTPQRPLLGHQFRAFWVTRCLC